VLSLIAIRRGVYGYANWRRKIGTENAQGHHGQKVDRNQESDACEGAQKSGGS
jgi:hypothetical protein